MQKIKLAAIILFFINNLNAQTHTIDVHSNNRVASLLMSSTEYSNWKTNDEFNNNDIRHALFKDIYKKFDDDFDFIFLILNEDTKPAGLIHGQLIHVSNNISGIGLGLFNKCSDYGSANKLKSVMQLTTRTSLYTGPSLHEIMHTWGNFGVSTESVTGEGTDLSSSSFIPHWGFTGGSSKGQLGGFTQNSLVENGSKSYTVDSFGFNANGGNSVPYNELELYLMGLTPLSSVSNFDVFSEISSFTRNGNFSTFTANKRTQYTPTSIENLLGKRSPSFENSQKNFKLLIMILTDTPLTATQWNDLDYLAERFGRSSSDDFDSYYNFWEATNGLATIEVGDLDTSTLRLESNALNEKINIYPIPANNKITIETPNNNFEELSITNVLGRTVFKKNLENTTNKLEIDLKKYPSGVYLIQFKHSSGKLITKKFILN